jgi:predicted metal-dependent HD superfamily phosphohydrolase
MDFQQNIVAEAEKFATQLLLSLPETMVYHNLNHTREVVKAATKIGLHHNLKAEEMEVLLIAAWMHDTGFVKHYDNHEDVSEKFADELMEKFDYPKDRAILVKAAIQSTRNSHAPQNMIESVLHDADFSHLARKSYADRSILLKTELERVTGKAIPWREWYSDNLKFLSTHQFFTDYGKTIFEPKALENIIDQKKLLKKVSNFQDGALGRDMSMDPERLKELKKKLRKVEGRPERGIETMFRLTSSNHIQLSSIADSKANILISVNAIIISIMMSGFLKALDTNPHLLIPTYMILTINVITIVFSVLALRPNITTGKFTRKDIEDKNTNLLFFGNFHDMERDDYKWGMTQMMSNSEYLYSSLIDDIYFLGRVLGKKYRFLRIAYNIFMYGIITAVLAYVIATYFYLVKL